MCMTNGNVNHYRLLSCRIRQHLCGTTVVETGLTKQSQCDIRLRKEHRIWSIIILQFKSNYLEVQHVYRSTGVGQNNRNNLQHNEIQQDHTVSKISPDLSHHISVIYKQSIHIVVL